MTKLFEFNLNCLTNKTHMTYCTVPFKRFEIFQEKVSVCCPNYLPDGCVDIKPLDPNLNLMDLWNNVRMRTVREQMCRGNYSACSEYLCPLVRLPDIGPVPKKFLDIEGPRHVKLSFDRGCNLHCRSCRESGKIIKTDDQIVHNLLRLFERDLSQSVQFLEADGAGDPFFSKIYRSWMVGFDPTRYPNLKSVKFHTNAQLFSEYFWNNRLTLIKPYVNAVEISIDAATEETYKKIRIGGDWKRLLTNLEFIFSIETITDIMLNFIVQKDNIPEISAFHRLMYELAQKAGVSRTYYVQYNRVIWWASVPEEQFNEIKIPESSEDYVKQQIAGLKKVTPIPTGGVMYVQTNI